MLLASHLDIHVAGGEFSWPSQQNFTNNPAGTIPKAKGPYIRLLSNVRDRTSKADQEAVEETAINTPGPLNPALAWELMPPPKPWVIVMTPTTLVC